jgi:hypothetical protein
LSPERGTGGGYKLRGAIARSRLVDDRVGTRLVRLSESVRGVRKGSVSQVLRGEPPGSVVYDVNY